MSRIQREVIEANAQYAQNFGDQGKLPMPPGRHFAILTYGYYFDVHNGKLVEVPEASKIGAAV
ncbi:MAG: hypothetical protein IT422_20875 [Pirellulaceae bacterium]|jgi:hypothetical protein|nr:hypothetical protein [Pirellulaceae bacterium]